MYSRCFSLPLDAQTSFFIFGPRGCGKTRWLTTHLKDTPHVYIDLLAPKTFRALQANPEKLNEMIPPGFTGWIVIDEVQREPELLNEVHRLIEHENMHFILTGSSTRKLKQKGVNLLAGRALRYHMHPLIAQELENDFNLTHAIQYGMLPATYHSHDIDRYLDTYVETYLREEVMQEGIVRNVSAFARFLEVASYSQGSTINATEISREVGIDRQVIQNYFGILNDLLLSHNLPAFTKRAKRRLIQKERFYYFDAGVFQKLRPKGLLDRASESNGVALETLLLQSLLAVIDYNNLPLAPYYWRTASGIEVDFVIYGDNLLLGIEVKHTSNITPKMLSGLKAFKSDYPEATLIITYLGNEVLHLAESITAIPFDQLLKKLPAILQGKSL